jgi:hypothetical protein
MIDKSTGVLLGSVLSGVVAAILDLTSLFTLIRGLHWDHWKFGSRGYLDLSLSLAPFICVGVAIGYLILAGICSLVFRRTTGRGFVHGGVLFGLLAGALLCFTHVSDLRRPNHSMRRTGNNAPVADLRR